MRTPLLYVTRGVLSATLGAVILCGLPCSGQASNTPAEPPSRPVFPTGNGTPLGAQIAALLADPGVSRAHWGIAVMAMDGTPIYGWDEGKFFRPASNAKLFTTAAAMALLGPLSATTTEVRANEDVPASGVLTGNIVLVGDGDANLSGRVLPYESPAARKAQMANSAAANAAQDPLKVIDDLAAQIAAKGVREVKGAVVGDDSRWFSEPYPDTWGLDDVNWSYGAPVSALAVNDNSVEITIHPASHAGEAATATFLPDVGFYRVEMAVRTVAKNAPAELQIDRKLGSEVIVVRGTIAEGAPYREDLAVSDPVLFAAEALKASLGAHGIKVDGASIANHSPFFNAMGFTAQTREPLPALPTAPVLQFREGIEAYSDGAPRVLSSHISPSLAEDVTVTLKVSQNLHAEMLLKRLGAAYGTAGSFAQGVRVVRQFLLNAGIDGDDFVFYDGSGLSGHDLVTPRATAQLLAYATKQPWFAQWKAALPVGGEDGTLSSRFPDAPLKDHLFAKTGTLGESRGLSGYVDTASGREVILSIFVDDHAPNGSNDREVMDKIVAAIAAGN